MFSVRTIPLIPLFYSLTSGSENTLFSYLNLDSALGIVLSPTHEELHVMEGDANAELMKLFFSTCEKMSVTFQQNSVKVWLYGTRQMNYESEYLLYVMVFQDPQVTVQESGVLLQLPPTDVRKSSQNFWIVG